MSLDTKPFDPSSFSPSDPITPSVRPPPIAPSRPPLKLNKKLKPSILFQLFSRVSMSIAIDNPLIFLYPNPIPTNSDQTHRPSHEPTTGPSHHPPQATQSRAAQQHPLTPFPSFRPAAPPVHHLNSSSNSDYHTLIDSTVDRLDSRSTILSGSLILKFSKPKEVRKIIISLCGQSYIGFNDRPYEYQTILSKDLELDLADQLFNCPKDQHPQPGSVHFNPQYKTFILDKGDYRFNWSFILPPDLPPYERGQFGRTTHKVMARVKLGSGLGLGLKTVGKNLSSILLGVGTRSHDIETESYFVAITNPSAHSEDITEDLGLNLNVAEYSDQLGPYILSASSCYFTVAGLLSFKLKLDSIPQRKKIIKIYKIACLIKQQYRLISIKDKDSKTGGPAESWPPCQRRKVFILDYSNVPSVNRVLPNGQPLDLPGVDQQSDLDATRDSNELDESKNDHGLVSHPTTPSSQQTSPPQSRSRSRIRGLLSSSGIVNHESTTSPERSQQQHSHHSSRSWSGLIPIRLGRRREEASRSEPVNPARDREGEPEGLYLTLSADQSQHSNDDPAARSPSSPNPINSLPPLSPPPSIHPEDSNRSSGSLSTESRSQRPRFHSQHAASPQSPLERGLATNNHSESHPAPRPLLRRFKSSQAITSAPLTPEPTRASSSSSSNAHSRGRHQEIVRPPGRSSRDKSTNSRSRGRKSRPEPHRGLSSHLIPEQEVPLVTLTDDHSSWEIEHIGRLPSDDIIRPSTNPGTQTNIHIFHTLLFEVHYSVEDDLAQSCPDDINNRPASPNTKKSRSAPTPPTPTITRKVLSIRKPVQISSCCCMVESMVLPPYSQFDPDAQFVQHPTPSHAARMFKCVCGMSTDLLLKTQNPKNPQSNANANSNQRQGATGQGDQQRDSRHPSSSVTHSTLTFRRSQEPSAADANEDDSAFRDERHHHHPSHPNLNNFDNSLATK